MSDNLARLAAAGFSIDAFTPEQLEVLHQLSPTELDLLVDVKGRLDDAGPDVEAHTEIAGGALF